MPEAEQEPAALVKILGIVGTLEQWLAHPDRAEEHFTRALAICRASDDRPGVVSMLRGLASIAIDRGDLERASDLLDDVLAQAPETGSAWEMAAASRLLGLVALTNGKYSEAIRRGEEAATRWHALGDTGHAAAAQVIVARGALGAGDHLRTATVAQDLLHLLSDAGDDILVCECFEIAAALAEKQGDPSRATRLLAASETMLQQISTSRWPVIQAAFERLAATTRRALGPSGFATTWEMGQALSLAEATAEAHLTFARVAGNTPPANRTHDDPTALTSREREVVRLLVGGLSDKEIAAALGITRHTASHHVRAIRAKLGVPSRAAVAALAVQHGIL
jgi:ATP/maltotriose-dependent transcriptional regulator MalT